VAITVLILATLVFAINTFDIFSMFYLIAGEFSEDVSFLGLMSAAMVIGIGLLQIPAGILAAKYGPKRVAVIGMTIIAISAVLVGMAADLYQIAVLRFILGGGLAFFFPSAIVLASTYIRKGSEAFGAGIVIGSNAAGGVIGLVGWALIGSALGWRNGIIIGAILAAAAAVVMYLLLPRIEKSGHFIIKASHIRGLLRDKNLIIIGVILLGSQAAFEQVLAFMPFYLKQVLTIEAPVAGLVGSFALMTALAGSPIIGWVYDRTHNLPVLTMILAGAMLVGVSVNYFQTLPAAILSAIIVGFVGGGLFTLLSNAGRERVATSKGEHEVEYTTLSVNWIHAIALTGTFWAPILFSSSAIQSGYSTAWPLIGILSFAIIATSVLIGYRARYKRS
jgi:MFS family permease